MLDVADCDRTVRAALEVATERSSLVDLATPAGGGEPISVRARIQTALSSPVAGSSGLTLVWLLRQSRSHSRTGTRASARRSPVRKLIAGFLMAPVCQLAHSNARAVRDRRRHFGFTVV